MLWILILSVILFILGFCLICRVMKDIPYRDYVDVSMITISAIFMSLGMFGVVFSILDMAGMPVEFG
ncbi:hypothetical protein NSA29_11475 [Staphylococcus warneri]|uniref:hypothetical protein n=1 Tax=Staphylococcus warneri TaxID=1292 RepID=UPI00214B0EF2|nr:hypothetical protein [Staphylococcus warneri]MCR1798160.1 hypothetical protein [Staphylococcus warneri]